MPDQKEKGGYVYILANRTVGTLYVGVTSDIVKRISEHKINLREGFTKEYGVHRLVYFEVFGDILQAIAREKVLKKWRRAWKIALIEKENPNWDDLFGQIVG